jgi:hypothetical protein
MDGHFLTHLFTLSLLADNLRNLNHVESGNVTNNKRKICGRHRSLPSVIRATSAFPLRE